jgi:glutathione S-transferase
MCSPSVGTAMPASRRFFTMPLSHYCVSVDRMLAFKGLPVEKRLVPYHDKAELLSATEQDFVPALLWDGVVVPWTEIPRFLEQQKPSPTLYPGDSGPVAEVVENWGHQFLEERVWRAVVTEVPATFSDPREQWVFEEIQSRARGPWHVLEQRKPEFDKDAHAALAMVDAMLARRPWILGEPSVADFGVFGGLSPWFYVGRAIPADLPNLRRWVEAIRSLGAVEATAQPSGPRRARPRAAK